MTTWLISQRPLSALGGVETFLSRLHPHVTARLLVGTVRGEDAGTADEVLRLPRRGPRSAWFAIRMLVWLRHAGRRADTFVVSRVELALPLLALGLGRRTIVLIHGSSAYSFGHFGWATRRIHLASEWLCVRFAGRTVVLMAESPYGMPWYRRRYGNRKVCSARVLVPPMPDLASREDDVLTIVYVGRIDDRDKRTSALAYMSRELRDLDHQVIVVGDGPALVDLKILLRTLGVSDRFRFLSVGDFGELSIRAHVGVIASRFEGMCLAALELLAAGIPVLSTNVGDIANYAAFAPVKLIEARPTDSAERVGGLLAAALRATSKQLLAVDEAVRSEAKRRIVNDFWEDAIPQWQSLLRL